MNRKTIIISIIILMSINNVSALTTSYCYDENSLFEGYSENISIGEIDLMFNADEIIKCDYGCSEFTILNMGYPGCKMSTILEFLIFIVFVVAVFISYWLVNK